jgi:hypothetical protein
MIHVTDPWMFLLPPLLSVDGPIARGKFNAALHHKIIHLCKHTHRIALSNCLRLCDLLETTFHSLDVDAPHVAIDVCSAMISSNVI